MVQQITDITPFDYFFGTQKKDRACGFVSAIVKSYVLKTVTVCAIENMVRLNKVC